MAGFYVSVLVLFVVQISFGKIPLKYEDKSTSPNKVVHVENAHVHPYPVVLPGDVTGDIVVHALRPVSGRYKLNISIHKKAIFWIKIPCISNVGSCSYDFCDLLNQGFVHNNTTECPPQLRSQNLPCTCPFKAGTYTLNPATFTIPKLDSLWSWLASGDYHVDATLVEEATGEEVANYHVELTMEQPPCSGFLCSIFGR